MSDHSLDGRRFGIRMRKKAKAIKALSCINGHDPLVLSLLAFCTQRELESKSIQKETVISIFWEFFVFKCCCAFTLSPVSSPFGNVENNIQFCTAFVCPFPFSKHGLFPPCFLQTFSQLSFSCLLPCKRHHWWYHSKPRKEVCAAFPSCLLHLVLDQFYTKSDFVYLLIF